jgi:signal peptidase II
VRKKTIYFLLPALFILALDQISKAWIALRMDLYESIPVVQGLFNLVHIRNRGIAFGMMNQPEAGFMTYVLIAVTLAAIALILVWYARLNDEDVNIILGLSLILGGALGNLIDRIRLGEVIDFLDFFVGSYHWPAFNVADSAITVGTLWMAIHLLFRSPADR